MTEIEENIHTVLDNFHEIANNGGYREKQELYRTVIAFGWFGYHDHSGVIQQRIEGLEEKLELDLQDDDIAEINPDGWEHVDSVVR